MKVTNRLFYLFIIIAIMTTLGACKTDEKANVESDNSTAASNSGIILEGGETKAVPEANMDQILAEYDGGTITLRDIKMLKKNNSIFPSLMTPYGNLSSEEQAKKLIELTMYHRLTAASPEAEALLAEDEKLEETLDGFRGNLLLNRYYKKNVADIIEVPEDEIAEYYEANKETYYLEPTVKARYIFIEARETDNEEKHAEARRRIEEVEKRLREGKDFVELVKAYSEAASKDNGGLIGNITKASKYNPELVEAVMKLEKDELSPIIKIRHGYYIFKADDRTGGDYRPLEDLESSIRGKLKRVKLNDAYPELIKKLAEKYNAAKSDDFDAFFAGGDASELFRFGDEIFTLADLKEEVPSIAGIEDKMERDKRLESFLQKEFDFRLIKMAAVDDGEENDIDFITSYQINYDYYITNTIIKNELTDSISVTDQDLLDYYEENKGTSFMGQDKWKLREIKKELKFPENSTMRDKHDIIVELKKQMSEIRRKIVAGEADFADMAGKHSDSPSKDSGGDLGWQEGLAKFSRPETKTLNTLETGEISEPLSIGDSHITIIQLLERKGGEIIPFDEVKEVCRSNAMANKAINWKEKQMEDILKTSNARVLDFDREILK
jgi:parvulin-like peptidyl-prolyl isomerase